MSKKIKLHEKQHSVQSWKEPKSFNDYWWLTVFNGKVDLPPEITFQILDFVLIDKFFLNNFGLTNKSAHYLTLRSIKSIDINIGNIDIIPMVILNNVRHACVKGELFGLINYKDLLKNLKKMKYFHIMDYLTSLELKKVCKNICKPLDMLKMSDNRVNGSSSRYELGRFNTLKTIIIDMQSYHAINKYDFKGLKVTNLVCGYYLLRNKYSCESSSIFKDNWHNNCGLKTMIYTSWDFSIFGTKFETITKLSIRMNSLGGTITKLSIRMNSLGGTSTWKTMMKSFPNVRTLNILLKFWSLGHDSTDELIGVLKEFKTPSLTKMVLFWYKTIKCESDKFMDFTHKTMGLQTLIHCFIPKMEEFPIKHLGKLIKNNCDDEGTWFIKCKSYRQFMFQIAHTVDEIGGEFDLG